MFRGVKKAFSVAKVTFRLFFRGGAGWGLIALVSILAGFMFFATNADNVLVNELRLRLKYSIYAFTILLNMALMYFACVSLRGDIDERRFHTVTSAPISRATVWTGKFLGTMGIGLSAFLAASATLAVCCVAFISNWSSTKDVESLRRDFFLTYYSRKPDLSEFDKAVAKEYAKRRKELEEEQRKHEQEKESEEHAHHCSSPHCHHDHEELEGGKWRARKYLLFDVRREMQMIFTNKAGKWFFDWDPDALKGDYVVLKFKFYSNLRRAKVRGEWTLSDASGDAPPTWTADFSGYPFTEHEMKIPVEDIPKTGRVKLVFKNKSNAYIFFPAYHDGLVLLSGHRGVFSNYLLLLLFSLAHMATLVALSLTFASLFSYSVAVFAALMMYLTAALSGLFSNVLSDLTFHDQTTWTVASHWIVKFGLWVTEGAKPFPVGGWFADGIAIPAATLVSSDGLWYLLYLAGVVAIGISALRVKEIDNIPRA